MDTVKIIELVIAFVGAIVSSGVGAYAGAKFAYDGERKHRLAEDRRKILQAARSALFILNQQYNLLLQYQRSVVEPQRNDPLAWLQMRVVSIGSTTDWNLDFRALEFLLGTAEHKLLFDIEIENRRFIAAANAISERVQFMISKVQPRISEIHAALGNNATIDQIVANLDFYCTRTAQVLYNELVSHVNETVISLPNIIKRLFEALTREFPGERFDYAAGPKANGAA